MQKVFLRADAGIEIGYGHFIRTLALADMLKEVYDCTFFTQNPTEYQRQEVAKVCELVSLPADDSKFTRFLDYLSGEEIVVLDNYFFSTDYQKAIKSKGCKLVCIDDIHDKHFVADVVINHAPGTEPAQYSREDYTRLCLGPEYLLLRKEFRDATLSYTSFKEKKNVYVCFGGSDELNFTLKACEIILNHAPKHIDVVVGGGYSFYDELKEFAKEKDITIYRNASPAQMVGLLQESCLAVVPDSMVFFEACCLRRPIISGYDCDNQCFISQYNQENNLSCDLGDFLDDFDNKFKTAYQQMNVTVAVDYIHNQLALINDSSEKLIKIFKSL